MSETADIVPAAKKSRSTARRRFALSFLVLIVATFFIWRYVRASDGRAFANAVSNASHLTLYEGLPHQTFERESFVNEQRTKPTIVRLAYPFYSEPLQLSDADNSALKQILSDADTFEQFYAESLCGGFHPDFAVEFEHDSIRYTALLCFGCSEAKVTRGGAGTRYELNAAAAQKLKALLATYRKNRPPKKVD